jgi:hypothetical protein
MLSSLPSGYGGSFAIEAKSGNAPVMVNVHSAPLDSLLLLNASTSLADVTTYLPSAYEGSFDVSTTPGIGKVDIISGDFSDPAGKDRKRERTHTTQNSGRVSWQPRRKTAVEGRAVVRTQMGKATLVL